MKVDHLVTNQQFIAFPPVHEFGSNAVHILTGNNGSGKSETLRTLANFFGQVGSDSQPASLSWSIGNNYNSIFTSGSAWKFPNRTITQTFSPFTRFLPSTLSTGSLLDVYAHGEEGKSSYICTGLHSSTRVIGKSLSKQVLEQSLFRMSESANYAEAVSKVLKEIGMGNVITLFYTCLPSLWIIINSDNRRTAIQRAIMEARDRSPAGSSRIPKLAAESYKNDITQLIELISAAIEQLERIEVYKRVYELRFNFAQRRVEDFSTFQALALLRRLGFLNLKSCFINNDYDELTDVSNTSSGQQQMLCSALSLATAITDNSLILIDEPELSLHPRWQQLYFDFLIAAIKPFNDCHVIIATHSPLVVQSGMNQGAGIIKMGGNPVRSDDDTRDTSVESALIDIFETPVEDSMQLASIVFDAVANGENATLSERTYYIAKLNNLKRIYSSNNGGQDIDQKIINDAIRILEIN